LAALLKNPYKRQLAVQAAPRDEQTVQALVEVDNP